jgi:hypothetical protein
MAGTTDEHLPWNEGSALEELERIKEAIEECRRRRKELQAEFDGFVRSFRSSGKERTAVEPGNTNIGAAGEAPQPAPIVPASSTAIPLAAPLPPIAAAPADHPPEPAPPSFVPAVVEPPVSAPPAALRTPTTPATNWRTRRMSLVGVAAAVGVVVIAGFLMARSGPRPADATSSTVANRAAAPARPPAQSAAVPSNPPSEAVQAGPPRSEILAVRRVWVRVVVDGVKAAEREMEAGERVTLPAGATAAIRAGNAGAVRVTVNGEDRGLLGAEGEVLTRTVRIPAASR